jgi:hypothetical protein
MQFNGSPNNLPLPPGLLILGTRPPIARGPAAPPRPLAMRMPPRAAPDHNADPLATPQHTYLGPKLGRHGDMIQHDPPRCAVVVAMRDVAVLAAGGPGLSSG